MGKVEFTQLQRILMPGPSTISLLYDPFLAGINPHRTSGTPYTSRMPLFSSLFSIKCFPPERNKKGKTRTSRSRLQHIQSDLFRKCSVFSTFIQGSHFLLPQSANNGKREFFQLQNWMRQGVSSAWGIQTGQFAAHWATFVSKFFQLFHSYTGRPILITPEVQ